MEHGRIVGYGTYRKLLARGVDFHAEVEDEDPAETASSMTPEAFQGSNAAAAVPPVVSVDANSNTGSGGGLPNASPAKLGQHSDATGQKSLATTLRKGDFVKVKLGCRAASSTKALSPRGLGSRPLCEDVCQGK
jgi:hypothetical protein